MAENLNENAVTDDAAEATELELEQEQEATEAELLAGLPKMAEPHRLRMRQKNMLKRIAFAFGPFFEALRATADEDGVTHANLLAPDDYEAMFDALDAIDAFGEALAVNKDAYVAWSEGKGEAEMFALYKRYQRAAGE